MPQDGEERDGSVSPGARFAHEAFEARERLLEEIRQLLRERNLLLQRVRKMAVDTTLPVNVRLSAIALWTEPWGRVKRMTDIKKEETK